MKFDGKYFGDHLATFSKEDLAKEVDSTFANDPKKEKKVDELFELLQKQKAKENGDDSRDDKEV
jgi:hypothetical protein